MTARDSGADEAISDLMNRYFSSLDRRDWNMLSDCFTPHATASYNSGATELVGRSDIVSWVSGMFGAAPVGVASKSSIHNLANIAVSVSGQTGSADAFAVANLVDGPGCPVVVRGLRYTGGCVLLGSDWLFDKLTHQALWQYHIEAEPPRSRRPDDPASPTTVCESPQSP